MPLPSSLTHPSVATTSFRSTNTGIGKALTALGKIFPNVDERQVEHYSAELRALDQELGKHNYG